MKSSLRPGSSLECVFLSLTGSCRFSCNGCIFQDHSTVSSSSANLRGMNGSGGFRPLSSGEFNSLIREMKEMNISKLKFGFADEPLLHPDAAKYAALAGEVGIDVGITTNDLSLDENISRDILEAGVTSVIVSLNVSDHGNITGREDIKRAGEGLLCILEARENCAGSGRAPTCIMAAVVERDSGGKDIEDVIRFIENRGKLCDGVIINSFLERVEPGSIMTRNPRRPLGSRKPCKSPCKELYLMADGSTFPCVPAAARHVFMKRSSSRMDSEIAFVTEWAETWNLGSWHDFSLLELAENSLELQRMHEEARFDEVELCRQCMAWCQHYPTVRKKGAYLIEETSFWTCKRIVKDETEKSE